MLLTDWLFRRTPAAFCCGRVDGGIGVYVFREEGGVFAHAVARSLDLDDDGMMEQTVEQRGGDDWTAEDVTPFGEAAVRGEDHCALLVTGIDQLEEQVAATGCDWQVADLVDDQQRGAAKEANAFTQGALAFGLGKLGDEISECDEVDEFAGTHGLDGERGGKMALAGAWWSKQMDNFGAGNEVEPCQRHDPIAIERRLEGEVEPGERS